MPALCWPEVRGSLTHHDEVFEAVGRVVYVSPVLGMGVAFETVTTEEQAKLERWLSATEEY